MGGLPLEDVDAAGPLVGVPAQARLDMTVLGVRGLRCEGHGDFCELSSQKSLRIFVGMWAALTSLMVLSFSCGRRRRRTTWVRRWRQRRWNVDTSDIFDSEDEDEDGVWSRVAALRIMGRWQRPADIRWANRNGAPAADPSQNRLSPAQRQRIQEEEERRQLLLLQRLADFTVMLEDKHFLPVSSSDSSDSASYDFDAAAAATINAAQRDVPLHGVGAAGGESESESEVEAAPSLGTGSDGMAKDLALYGNPGGANSVRAGAVSGEANRGKKDRSSDATLQSSPHFARAKQISLPPSGSSLVAGGGGGNAMEAMMEIATTGAASATVRRPVANMCTVCLEPFRPDDRVCWSSNASCPHAFHEQCILQWLVTLGRREKRQRRRRQGRDDGGDGDGDGDRDGGARGGSANRGRGGGGSRGRGRVAEQVARAGGGDSSGGGSGGEQSIGDEFPTICPCCRRDFIVSLPPPKQEEGLDEAIFSDEVSAQSLENEYV